MVKIFAFLQSKRNSDVRSAHILIFFVSHSSSFTRKSTCVTFGRVAAHLQRYVWAQRSSPTCVTFGRWHWQYYVTTSYSRGSNNRANTHGVHDKMSTRHGTYLIQTRTRAAPAARAKFFKKLFLNGIFRKINKISFLEDTFDHKIVVKKTFWSCTNGQFLQIPLNLPLYWKYPFNTIIRCQHAPMSIADFHWTRLFDIHGYLID